MSLELDTAFQIISPLLSREKDHLPQAGDSQAGKQLVQQDANSTKLLSSL